MFKKDFFESAPSNAPRTQAAAPVAPSPTEQTFWHVVRLNPALNRSAEELKTRGRFEAVKGSTANYIYFRFTRNGQDRNVGAEITPNVKPQQIHNFLEGCKKALIGAIEYSDIRPYLPPSRQGR